MQKENLDRRGFLKRLGLGVSTTGLALAGCESAGKKILSPETSAAFETGEMTYRVNPTTGDKVSMTPSDMSLALISLPRGRLRTLPGS